MTIGDCVAVIAFFAFWLLLLYGEQVLELVKLWLEKRNK